MAIAAQANVLTYFTIETKRHEVIPGFCYVTANITHYSVGRYETFSFIEKTAECSPVVNHVDAGRYEAHYQHNAMQWLARAYPGSFVQTIAK